MNQPSDASIRIDRTADVAAAEAAWRPYLDSCADATIYHDPRWGGVMGRVYRNGPLYLTARRDGRVVGLLQLVAQRSLLFGAHLTSLPYFDAAGILADDEPAREALLAEARRLVTEERVAWIELRQAEPLDETLPTRTDKVALRLALPDDPDVLWKALKPKVRNQVRKAEKASLVAEAGGGEHLDDFYAVYSRNMRDLGSPPHAPRFFRSISDAFGSAVHVIVVRQGAEPVAAGLTLEDRHGWYIPWAGSDWRLRARCPNMLLYWSILAEACRGGASRFDFGRSTRDGGTYRFKRQWGAEEAPLWWHYLTAPGREPPDLRPDSGKYRFLVACWRRLPVGVARLLGPRIISKLA